MPNFVSFLMFRFTLVIKRRNSLKVTETLNYLDKK